MTEFPDEFAAARATFEAQWECAAASGETLLELTHDNALVDRGVVALFAEFGFNSDPAVREAIELGLATFARLALAGAAAKALADADDLTTAAVEALREGDIGGAADLTIQIVDRYGVTGEAHRLLSRWVWSTLGAMALAETATIH